MVKSRRVFTREFKLAVGQRTGWGKPLGYVARQLEVNPNTLHRWRREFREQPTKAFSGEGVAQMNVFIARGGVPQPHRALRASSLGLLGWRCCVLNKN